jgi:O-antigen/teichoic acid export membrane protein
MPTELVLTMRSKRTDAQIASRPRALSIGSSFAWMSAANIVYASSLWIVIILLTRVGSPELAGIFAFGLATTAPIMQVASLQLRILQSTEKMSGFTFREFLSIRGSATTIALLVILLIVSFSDFDGIKPQVVLLVGLCKAIEQLSDLVYGHFQQEERLDKVATSLVLRGVLSAVSVGVVIWQTGSLLLAITALGGTWLGVLLLLDTPRLIIALRQKPESAEFASQTKGERRPRGRLRSVRTITKKGLLLGLVVGFSSLLTNIPTYLVEHSQGDHLLGIFAGIAALVRVGFFIESALGHSAIPRLTRLFDTKDHRGFLHLLRKLLCFAASLGLAQVVVAVIAGRWVLEFVYGPPFGEYSSVLIIMMIASAVGYVVGFLKASCNAAKAYAQQIPLYAIAAAASILIGIPLVKAYALQGAAITITISRLIVMAGYSLYLYRATRMPR